MNADDVMDAVLRLRDAGMTSALTEEMAELFRHAGCDPHCHFCNVVLKVGDTFGFLPIIPGSQGTACQSCWEKKKAPSAEAVADASARVYQKASTEPEPVRPGFILYDR